MVQSLLVSKARSRSSGQHATGRKRWHGAANAWLLMAREASGLPGGGRACSGTCQHILRGNLTATLHGCHCLHCIAGVETRTLTLAQAALTPLPSQTCPSLSADPPAFFGKVCFSLLWHVHQEPLTLSVIRLAPNSGPGDNGTSSWRKTS